MNTGATANVGVHDHAFARHEAPVRARAEPVTLTVSPPTRSLPLPLVRSRHPYLTSSANEGRSSDGDATFPSTGLSRPSQGTSYSDNPYTAGTSDDDRDRDADSDPDVDDRADLLASQHTILQSQDDSLDKLSASIGRQRDLSLQMNDELELHSELLDDLDRGVEHTGLRLGRASGRLEKVRKSLKDHGKCVAFLLRVVLLLLLCRAEQSRAGARNGPCRTMLVNPMYALTPLSFPCPSLALRSIPQSLDMDNRDADRHPSHSHRRLQIDSPPLPSVCPSFRPRPHFPRFLSPALSLSLFPPPRSSIFCPSSIVHRLRTCTLPCHLLSAWQVAVLASCALGSVS